MTTGGSNNLTTEGTGNSSIGGSNNLTTGGNNTDNTGSAITTLNTNNTNENNQVNSLAYTGIEDNSILAIVIVLGVIVAVYSFKKVKEYNNC